MKNFIWKIVIVVILLSLSVNISYSSGSNASDKENISSDGKLKELTLYTPPAGVGVLMVDVVNSQALNKYVEKLNVVRWNNPDQLRAGIINGSMNITFLPSYVGAKLYNKGITFQLLNIVTGGLLYVISRDPSLKTIDDLRGKRIVVPFKNDMPDLVLRSLLTKISIKTSKDITIEYVATPEIAAKMAIAGKADTVLLPEVAATKVTLMSKKEQNIPFQYAIDIQKEWGRLMQTKNYIPQAGVAVRKSFAEKNPKLVKALHKALQEASTRLMKNEKHLKAMVEKLWPNQGVIFTKSIGKWNMNVQSSVVIRSDLEHFFKTLKALNPSIIGGKLPNDGFYYQ